MKQRNSYSPELPDRAVRLVLDQQSEHGSQWAAIISVSLKVGCAPETLRKWVRQAERDQGRRAGLTSSERERLKTLERENRELHRTNEICARRQPILPRRSSTADRSHDVLHRRPSG